MICPGDPANPLQYIDVRDLSEFCLHLVEQGTPGVFNGAGPSYSELSLQEFIYAVRGVTASDIKFTWIDETFLMENGIEAFGFPLWISLNSEYKGLARVSIERSVKHGLTCGHSRSRPTTPSSGSNHSHWSVGKNCSFTWQRDAKILEA